MEYALGHISTPKEQSRLQLPLLNLQHKTQLGYRWADFAKYLQQ